MKTQSIRGLGAVGLFTINALAVVVTACNGDDTSGSVSPAPGDAGSSDAAIAPEDAGSSDATPDAGSPDAATTTTLYERLGGKTGIAAGIDKIVNAELQDPEVASYYIFVAVDGG